jgi:hypothetical protein
VVSVFKVSKQKRGKQLLLIHDRIFSCFITDVPPPTKIKVCEYVGYI